ncbi:MAG TPA: hypothetical protein VES62_07760 [Thermoleophilaceae bacterium]|nr:hypothetical protein [Thermoleophilaceae bacterium]
MSGARAGQLAAEAAESQSTPVKSGSVQQALEAIAAYIPAEALALFLSAYSVMQPEPLELRLILVAGGIVAVVVAIWAGFEFNVRSKARLRRFLLLIVFGVFAFGAWVFAMPGGPFSGKVSLFGQEFQVALLGGVLVLLFAFLLPILARALKLRPQAS